jgi:membrane associated rhomboid family serine protease
MSLPQPPAPQITTCYRHPNREAGRRCTRCGRPACTECLVRADIGSQCVDCAKASRPDVRTRARYWNARQPTLVTYAIIAINVAVFVWIGAKDPDSLGRRGVSFEQRDLALSEYDLAINNEWYRLVTSGFLHFGVLHIALNMFLLFQLGQMLEPMMGRVRFGLLYAAALLGGSAGVMLINQNPLELHGGASGAVFGLMGAASVILFQRGINPLTTGLGMTVILNLVITFSIPGISIGGHLGGLAAGALAGWFMAPSKVRRFPEWITYAAPAAVGILAVVVSVVVATSSDVTFVPGF